MRCLIMRMQMIHYDNIHRFIGWLLCTIIHRNWHLIDYNIQCYECHPFLNITNKYN